MIYHASDLRCSSIPNPVACLPPDIAEARHNGPLGVIEQARVKPVSSGLQRLHRCRVPVSVVVRKAIIAPLSNQPQLTAPAAPPHAADRLSREGRAVMPAFGYGVNETVHFCFAMHSAWSVLCCTYQSSGVL